MKVLRMIGWLLLMMILVAGGIYVYNLWLNQTFVTTFYTMETDKPVEGLRLVELSDLHLSEYGEKNADLVQRVQDLAPDLIVAAGDMDIDTNDDYSVVTELMAQLVEIAPVYYAPGNHEWAGIYAFGSKNLAADMKALGVHWMDQCWEDVDIGESKLRIGGFFEWPRAELERKGSRQVVEAMDGNTNDLSDRFTLLISHCPELFYTSLKDTQIDLGISGHAHGGLMRLPWTDGLWSTSQGFLPKYTSGLRQIGESTVVISRGLGDSEPYPRIFNQPELVVLDMN